MYSLVNTPALCRDLARHPDPVGVIDDLLAVFALDEPLLTDLDITIAIAAASVRREVRARMSQEARALDVLSATRHVAADSGVDAWTAAVDLLERAPLGGVDDLLRFVDDVLAHAWDRAAGVAVARWSHALDVVRDGVTASYAAPACGRLAHVLGRPWRSWLSARDVRPARCGDARVARVIDRLGRADDRSLAQAGDAIRAARASGWSWPDAMHDACWAVHLTGRDRSAAIAQLSALRALVRAAAPHPPRPGAVAAVVAAVHATMVDDVLATATVRALTQPLFRSLP